MVNTWVVSSVMNDDGTDICIQIFMCMDLFVYFGCCPNWFLLSTWVTREEETQTEEFPISVLACGQDFERLSWLMIDMTKPTVGGTFARQVGMDCIIKLDHEPGSKPGSSFPSWFLLQIPALSSFPGFPQ